MGARLNIIEVTDKNHILENNTDYYYYWKKDTYGFTKKWDGNWTLLGTYADNSIRYVEKRHPGVCVGRKAPEKPRFDNPRPFPHGY